MAVKARLFKDHRAVEFIMSSSDASTHKRVGRGVRSFDTAVWDRDKQNTVLSGNYAKLTQNATMNIHLLSTGNKISAGGSALYTVWGIGLRADGPRAKDQHKWRANNSLGEALSLLFAKQFATARSDRHTRPALVDSAAPPEKLETTIFCPLRSGRAWIPRSTLIKALLWPIYRVHPPINARWFQR